MAVINKGNLIAKVIGLIQDHVIGDTVLLIEHFIPTALKTVCKFAALNKPLGHEKLLLQQSLSFSVSAEPQFTDDTFSKVCLFNSTTYPMIELDNMFKSAFLITLNDNYRAYPTHSFFGLNKAVEHDTCYYFIDHNNVFIKYSGTIDLNSPTHLLVTNYIYADITQFPEELEDLLVAELIRLIQNEPNKQRLEASNIVD